MHRLPLPIIINKKLKIMNKIKIYARLLVVILMGLFIFSCNEDDSFDIKNQNDDIEIKSIDLEQAKQVAVNFYNEQVIIEKSRSSKKKDLKFKKKENIYKITLDNKEKSLNDNFSILQFENGGYVIVSNTERQTPILAFSTDGVFKTDEDFQNNLALQEWFINQSEEIEYLKTHLESTEKEKEKELAWNVYMQKAPPIDDEFIISGGTIYQELSPLLSTNWNQGSGYNNLVPLACSSGGSGGRAWTGCVATALAQVMKYHEYPNNYNWSIMPNNIGSTETSILMRDIGYAVNMDYGCDGSGASMEDAKNALKNNFDYSNGVRLINYDTEILWQQLQLWSNPVILSGGTHAWVCDGYKRYQHAQIHNPGTYYEYTTYFYSQFYLHMNWGWGGAYNTWYLYNDFTPGTSNYNSNKKMIIWAQP